MIDQVAANGAESRARKAAARCNYLIPELSGTTREGPSSRALIGENRKFTSALLDLGLPVPPKGPIEPDRRAWAMQGQEQFATIPARLGAVVPMGPPRHFSALAVDLEEGREAACALIEGLRAPMLEAADAAPDTRPPRPHLTLTRVRRRAPAPERRAAIAWASGLALPAALLRFEELVLYTWADDRQRGLFIEPVVKPSGCGGEPRHGLP